MGIVGDDTSYTRMSKILIVEGTSGQFIVNGQFGRISITGSNGFLNIKGVYQHAAFSETYRTQIDTNVTNISTNTSDISDNSDRLDDLEVAKKSCFYELHSDEILGYSLPATATWTSDTSYTFNAVSNISTLNANATGDTGILDASGYIHEIGQHMINLSFELDNVDTFHRMKTKIEIYISTGALIKSTLYTGLYYSTNLSLDTCAFAMPPTMFNNTSGSLYNIYITTSFHFKSSSTAQTVCKCNLEITQI
jgi:hypothetical protein